jgi:hypothetical protein
MERRLLCPDEACENDKRDKLGKCSICIETNTYPARIVYMHAYQHLVIEYLPNSLIEQLANHNGYIENYYIAENYSIPR